MTHLWRYRQWIWDAAVADIRERYAGSALGVFWNVLTPLAMLVVYSAVFSSIFIWRGAGMLRPETFPLYIASGFLTWGAFADSVSRGSSALLDQGNLIRRLALPEIVFVARAALGSALQMIIVLPLLLAFAIIVGQPPQLTWLVLPVLMVSWVALGFGIAVFFSGISVFIRDINQALNLGLQVWMWSIPVVYVEDILPEVYQDLLPFNPAYWFLHGIRSVLFEGELPPLEAAGAMSLWIIGSLALGMFVLGALRTDIRDAL